MTKQGSRWSLGPRLWDCDTPTARNTGPRSPHYLAGLPLGDSPSLLTEDCHSLWSLMEVNTKLVSFLFQNSVPCARSPPPTWGAAHSTLTVALCLLSASVHQIVYFPKFTMKCFMLLFFQAQTNIRVHQRYLLPRRKKRERGGAGLALRTFISSVSLPLTCISQLHPCEQVRGAPSEARHVASFCQTVMGHSHPCTGRLEDSKLRRGKCLSSRSVWPVLKATYTRQNGLDDTTRH